MKGMELSRKYFDEYGLPMLKQKFPQYIDKMAAGLAGEGSECLGFDDEYSQDHDFGAGFCIWLPDDLYRSIGAEIQKEYDRLPETYMGISRNITAMNPGRTGAMSTEDFYFRYTGLRRAPQDNMEWFRIPEHFLATVTNGQVLWTGSDSLQIYGRRSSDITLRMCSERSWQPDALLWRRRVSIIIPAA